MDQQDKIVQISSSSYVNRDDISFTNFYGISEHGSLYVLNGRNKWIFVTNSPLVGKEE